MERLLRFYEDKIAAGMIISAILFAIFFVTDLLAKGVVLLRSLIDSVK